MQKFQISSYEFDSEFCRFLPSSPKKVWCEKIKKFVSYSKAMSLFFFVVVFIYIVSSSTGVTIKVLVVDLESEIIHPPITVHACHSNTVAELKELISQVGTNAVSQLSAFISLLAI